MRQEIGSALEKRPLLYSYGGNLVEGVLLLREKRFLVHCRLKNGEEVTAHCANPGSMKGVLEQGNQRIWLSRVTNPKAKLRWRLEIIESSKGVKVGVYPSLANEVTNVVLEQQLLPNLAGYDTKRREVKYGESSRVDFLLSWGDKQTYLEVKSVTMSRVSKEGYGSIGEFPDAKTQRGLKHLQEMEKLIKQGCKAVMMYVVQRGDCGLVSIAEDIDPAYGEYMRYMVANYKGDFSVISYRCEVNNEGLHWRGECPFLL